MMTKDFYRENHEYVALLHWMARSFIAMKTHWSYFESVPAMCCKYSPACQMCANLRQKIVPDGWTIYFCLSNICLHNQAVWEHCFLCKSELVSDRICCGSCWFCSWCGICARTVQEKLSSSNSSLTLYKIVLHFTAVDTPVLTQMRRLTVFDAMFCSLPSPPPLVCNLCKIIFAVCTGLHCPYFAWSCVITE